MTDAALPALAAIGSDTFESPTQRALRRLFKRKGAVVGLIVIVAFILLALFAPLIVPYDPIATNWALVRKPATSAHWFGTDDLGRDVLARVVYGSRASLAAGAISVSIALVIGVPLGLLSGYRGGFVDGLISRLTDAMLACPFLILAIALAAFLGPRNAASAMARIRNGQASMASVIRLIKASMKPPRYPEIRPNGTPTPSAIPTEMAPAVSEARAP